MECAEARASVCVCHTIVQKQAARNYTTLGHSDRYDFGLELETALAKTQEEV